MDKLGSLKFKKENNYVPFFITLACNLRCPYCINLSDGGTRYKMAKRRHLRGKEWITAANRLVLRDDLPLTLQGGEPTMHKDFYEIVNGVKKDIKMDLLTNMSFDTDKFIRNVPVWRFAREAPYAAIRVSYHPGQNKIDDLIKKTFKLRDAGFRVGIYGIAYPDKKQRQHILETMDKCLKLGIDFRTKEYLGQWEDELCGVFKYPGAVQGKKMKTCECKTTEMIVDPGGYVYKCHSDMHKGRDPVGHILDANFTDKELNKFRKCAFYGDCNPCDVKVKTNRLQVFGHTSVEIRNIKGGKIG
jgi:hypothetical protein